MFQGRKVAVLALILMLSLISIHSSPETAEGLELGVYHSSFEISEVLMGLHENNTDITEYSTAQDLFGTRSIPGDRDLPILFTGDRDEDRPWIMVIGAHHGDEPDSAEVVLAFAEHLLVGYNNGDPMQTHLIEDINIAILPVVNPYGLDILEREDENGEDPNRDYPFEPTEARYDSDGVPLTTAGAHAVHSLAMMYPFSIALSFHTGSQGIFYPWGAPNVGDISPDGISFDSIGMELGRSSGVNMVTGPANSYPYVADLSGAFDDHLYGSTFLSDHLYSEEMQLPWSTYTATVELHDMKGPTPSTLGDTEDLWNHPLTDTDTIPRGVRVCYSACQLVSPRIDVEMINENDTIMVSGKFTGVSTLGDISLTIDGEPVNVEVDPIKNPLLPEYSFEFEITEPASPGSHHLGISAYPDDNWDEMDPMAEQKISPISIIADSREPISWSGYFFTESEEPPFEPVGLNATLNLTGTPEMMEAGEPGHIMADIDFDRNLTLEELVVVLKIDEWEEVTRYGPDEIEKDYLMYPISTVPMAGEAEIIVNLTFEEGSLIEKTIVELIPTVRILSAVEDPENNDNWKILIGLQGGYGPTPVYWGVIRGWGEEWASDQWVIPPSVEIANGYGPHTIEINLNEYGGMMHFRVSTVIGTKDETYDLWKQIELNPDGNLKLTELFINATDDDDITFGPMLMISRLNGLESVGPEQRDIDIWLEVWMSEDDSITVPMHWKYRVHMSEEEIRTLDLLAIQNGLDPDEVEGAYFGTVHLEDVAEKLDITIWYEGSYYHNGNVISNFLGEIVRDRGYLVENREVTKEEHDKDFPVPLFIFLLVVAACILLITYLRYKHHWKDPVPEEDKISERPRRRPDIRRQEKIEARLEDGPGERHGRKRAPAPPWQR